MKGKNMKVVLVDTEKNTIEVKTIKDDLDEIYKYLKCDLFDVARRKIGKHAYDIIADDLGFYADNPICTAVNPLIQEDILVGNLIICRHEGNGEFMSLNDNDIFNILIHTGTYKDGDIDRVAVMIGV